MGEITIEKEESPETEANVPKDSASEEAAKTSVASGSGCGIRFKLPKLPGRNRKRVVDSTMNTEADIADEQEFKRRRRKIFKNLMVISLAFLFVFTAYQSLLNLQSSLNSNLGTGSLSIIYASLVFSCMFVPNVIIKTIGCKWTIFISIVIYALYMLANFYPSWSTLVPSSLVLGAATAPLWSAKCTYLTSLAVDYAQLTQQAREEVISRFFGIFFITFQSSQIWGNWLSSAMLDPETWDGNDTDSSYMHLTSDEADFYSLHNPIYKYCGGTWNSCRGADLDRTNNTNFRSPSPKGYHKLVGLWIACVLTAALLVAVLFDQLDSDAEMLKDGNREKPRIEFNLFKSTLKHLKSPHQVALIPLTIYSGLEQAFVAADFTKVCKLKYIRK